MRKSSVFLIFLMMLGILRLSAQQVPPEALENILEKILPTQYEEDVDVEQVYENLLQFYLEPLNLNGASADELRQFFFLSERQINNIIRYREYYGSFLSQFELALIPSLDQQSIQSLLPFISIQPPQDRNLTLRKRVQKASNRYFLLRQSTIVEPKKGYLSNDSLLALEDQRYYQGSPHHVYARMRISQPGSISMGFTLEKDAGEKIAWDKAHRKYGADFFSGHFQIEKAGPIDQLMIGDYSFQAGQQLVFGSGLGLGKGALTVRSVGRSQHGIRPYTSSTEGGFLRGVATSWKFPGTRQHLKFTTLYSSNRQHAKVYSDSVDHFRNFDLSGLHRNDAEMLDRNQVQVNYLGGNLHFTNRYQNFQLGLNFLHTTFSLPMIPSEVLYKKHDFRGERHSIGSVYFSYQFQHWHSFAEVARSYGNQYGMVAGINGVLNSYLESVWLYRNYSPGFYSPYGNAFGESTRNANEEGLYWGLKLEPIAKLSLGAYYDLFRFPWLRYRVDAPSRGQEYLLRAAYQLNRSTNLVLQYRQENKGINVSSDSLSFRIVGEGIRKNVVFHLDHSLSERVRFKTKIHSSSYALADSLTRGWVVAQDVSYSAGRWKADARFALINTDDYNNRQYLYENDVLYAFSVPAYAGQGISYYLLMRYKINRHVSSWVRWGRMIYDDREVIGSGMEEITGNRRTQLKFQLMFKF